MPAVPARERFSGAGYAAADAADSRIGRLPRMRIQVSGPTTRRLMTVRTFSPKAADIQHQWHVIDASDVVLGRLASHVATLLRGKHKPIFAPHVDTGDFAIVVNTEKVAQHPEKVVEKAVKGMLPKNSLGRSMLRKLKVYAGPDHPHEAQQPAPFEIKQIAQQAPAGREAGR